MLLLSLALAAQVVPANIGERFRLTDRPYAMPQCRFRAVPELALFIPQKPGEIYSAMYAQTARETDPAAFLPAQDGNFHFHPSRTPDAFEASNTWRGLYQSSASFEVKGEEFRKGRVTAAELSIDGRKVDVDWLINQNDSRHIGFSNPAGGNSVRLEPSARIDTGMIAALAEGEVAAIRVFAGDQLLGERTFDVSNLRLVPDALAAADWKCD